MTTPIIREWLYLTEIEYGPNTSRFTDTINLIVTKTENGEVKQHEKQLPHRLALYLFERYSFKSFTENGVVIEYGYLETEDGPVLNQIKIDLTKISSEVTQDTYWRGFSIPTFYTESRPYSVHDLRISVVNRRTSALVFIPTPFELLIQFILNNDFDTCNLPFNLLINTEVTVNGAVQKVQKNTYNVSSDDLGGLRAVKDDIGSTLPHRIIGTNVVGGEIPHSIKMEVQCLKCLTNEVIYSYTVEDASGYYDEYLLAYRPAPKTI